MPPLRFHSSSPWPVLLIILLAALISVLRAMRGRQERREMWSNVLANAHAWAESVGGQLERVSEQPAVYGPSSRVGRGFGESMLIARRYRVTFIDSAGAQCVALPRHTAADGNWAFEQLTRDSSPDVQGEPSLEGDADSAAEGYARRHRAKSGRVPVIFAAPRPPKPPRRST
jgi:hypothetical protein